MLRSLHTGHASHAARNLQIPSLEEFLFRQRVRHTYRSLVRLIYKHHEKQELLAFARQEFKMNQGEKELSHRKYLLLLGESRMQDFAKMYGIGVKLHHSS